MTDTARQAWRQWWDEEGSAMRPLPNEDTEQFARRMTEIAWSNGAFKRLADVEYLCLERVGLERELAAEGATTASLLRIIALIREAGGFTREDLAALPGAVKAMRQQRDEARKCLRNACAEIARIETRFYDAVTPQQIAERNGWDCFKEGGGA